MTMSVEGSDPVLVGEWFALEVALDNLENSGAEDVTVSARDTIQWKSLYLKKRENSIFVLFILSL